MNLHSFRLLLIPFVTLIFVISGCKEKGCTDSSAINYNSVADEDDGSCIYCNATVDTLETTQIDLVDNNFTGPHAGQVVGSFTITQIKTVYNNDLCGTQQCGLQVSLTSLVPEEMSFTFSLQGSGNINFSFTKNVVVGPFLSQNLGVIPPVNINNPCGSLNNTSTFVSLFGSIVYN